MSYVDPLKVMRNPATLQAYRQHQRALRAAGQPWFLIGLGALALEIGLILFALFRGGFGGRGVYPILLLMFVYGLCFAIGSLRAWRYGRSHPLVLPEGPAAGGR